MQIEGGTGTQGRGACRHSLHRRPGADTGSKHSTTENLVTIDNFAKSIGEAAPAAGLLVRNSQSISGLGQTMMYGNDRNDCVWGIVMDMNVSVTPEKQAAASGSANAPVRSPNSS